MDMIERNLAVSAAVGSAVFALVRAIAVLVPLGWTLSHWAAV
jgi:hypothetical protein